MDFKHVATPTPGGPTFVQGKNTQPPAPTPANFRLVREPSKWPATRNFETEVRVLTELHARLVAENTQQLDLDAELLYCRTLVMFGQSLHDYHQATQKDPVALAGGLWFPMPRGRETNCLWGEAAFRIFRAALRFLDHTLTADRPNPTCEESLSLAERTANNNRVRRAVGLLVWFEKQGLSLWKDHTALLDELGLTSEYRAAVKECLRAYGIWNAGCIHAMKLMHTLGSGGTGSGVPAAPLHSAYQNMYSNMVDSHSASAPGPSSDTLASLSALDDALHNRQCTMDLQRRVSSVASLFMSSYTVMTALPEWIPLYGSSPRHVLSLYPQTAPEACLKTRAGRNLPCPLSLRSAEAQTLFASQHKARGYEVSVLHNMVQTHLFLEIKQKAQPRGNSRRQPVTCSWSGCNKVQFLLWLSRLAGSRGEAHVALACVRALTSNGFPFAGATVLESLRSSTSAQPPESVTLMDHVRSLNPEGVGTMMRTGISVEDDAWDQQFEKYTLRSK